MKLFCRIFNFLILALLSTISFADTPPNLNCDTNANNDGSKVGIFYYLQGQNSANDKAIICKCIWENSYTGCLQNKLCPHNPSMFYNIISHANFKTGTNNINVLCLNAPNDSLVKCKRTLVFFTSDTSVTGYTDPDIQNNDPGKTLSYQSCSPQS